MGDDQGGGFVAIRPVVNIRQNLNIPHSNPTPGAQICTWGWGDGQPNELWRFDQASVT
jgi:hypothetical protein